MVFGTKQLKMKIQKKINKNYIFYKLNKSKEIEKVHQCLKKKQKSP